MIKPKIKLVDFNKKKPNLQEKGYNTQGVPNGRIVVSIQDGDYNGYISKAVWEWKVTYDNFVLGTHEEHDEAWGDINENRKLGGTFPAGYGAVKFYFQVSRTYAKGSEIVKFTYNFTWTQAEGFKEIIDPVKIPSPVVPEPIKPEPKPEKFSKTPFIAFSAKSKIIIFLQAILYWKNYKKIMSHAFAGFLEDTECLTAEWKSLIRMNLKKMLDNALRYEIYLLPVKSEAQIQKAEALLAKMLNAKYNRYKHFLWYLNIKSLDFALLLPVVIILGLFVGWLPLKIYGIFTAVLYGPIRLYLKYLSKKTFDCIHSAGEFALCFETDIYNGEKKDSQSPDEACEKFRFANKHSGGKLFPLYKKK